MDNDESRSAPDASKVSLDQRVIVPAWGLGRWAPFNWERLPHTTGVRLFWGRIAVWLVIVACVGWLALASAAYGFVKYRRGFTEVQYHHMVLLPWKLDDYRRDKGLFIIREGLELAERQEWRPAFDALRTGLVAVPDHLEARLMVTRIYLIAGRPDIVRRTLIEGLEFHADQADYLRDVMGFFFGLGADDTVIELTQELRARLDPTTVSGRMAVTALAYAYFNRDRFTEAEQVMAEAKLGATPEGQFVAACTLWERDRNEDGIEQLRNLVGQVPENNQFYNAVIVYLTEERRWGEVRRVALSRQFALPDKPEAYVYFIVACGAQGDEAGRVAAEAAFLNIFADDVPALLKLAEAAARAGRVEVVARVVARCRSLGRETADAEMLLLLAQLERREYEAVLSAVARLSGQAAQWPERQRLVMGGLKAVALYGRGEEIEAEPLVRRLVETRVLPGTVFTALAEQLEKAGQGVQARRLLRHAIEVDPLNQPAVVMLLRSALVARELGEAVGLIERLLTMRKPSAELLKGLARELGSDRYLMLPGRVRVEGEIAARLAGGR